MLKGIRSNRLQLKYFYFSHSTLNYVKIRKKILYKDSLPIFLEIAAPIIKRKIKNMKYWRYSFVLKKTLRSSKVKRSFIVRLLKITLNSKIIVAIITTPQGIIL